MSALEVVFLAFLQGLTEFLPISRSGHLVLVQSVLDLQDPKLSVLEVFVHVGTLLSVLIFFRKDLWNIFHSSLKAVLSHSFKKEYYSNDSVRLGVALLYGSIPALIAGIAWHNYIDASFSDPKIVSVNLVITGLILFLTRLAKPWGARKVGVWSAVCVGIAQAIAIIPGISRSGVTISMGLYLKHSPVQAARFSLLLSIPVITGLSLIKMVGCVEYCGSLGVFPLALGVLIGALAGYLSIKVLLQVMANGKFHWFAFYCLLIGGIGILYT